LQKRQRILLKNGAYPDISDSKEAYELALEVASEMYKMFPYFIKRVHDHLGMMLDYNREGYDFEICSIIQRNSDSYGLISYAQCDEFRDYANFLYTQIQEHKLAPKNS
jgi:hypothetical protein